MPYSTKKGTGKDKGKTCVHKKSSKKKVGCTSGPIEKYLTALRMAESDDMDWIKNTGQNKLLTINKLIELFKKNNIDVDWDIEYDRTEDGHGDYNEYFGKFYFDTPETMVYDGISYFIELYEKENGQLFFYLYKLDEEYDKYYRDEVYSQIETSSKDPEKFWRIVGWLVLYQMGKINTGSGEETFDVENTINESDELEWIKKQEPEKEFKKSKSYVVDVRHLRPDTPISISPTSPEYTDLTIEDILDKFKVIGYDVDEIPVHDVGYLYMEPSDDAGYWGEKANYWVDYDASDKEDPTYGDKYQMINIEELIFLIDNKIISESTDFDWIKETNPNWSTYYEVILNDVKGLSKNLEDVTNEMLLPIWMKIYTVNKEIHKNSDVDADFDADQIEWLFTSIMSLVDNDLNGISSRMDPQSYYNTKRLTLISYIKGELSRLELIGESKDDFDWVREIPGTKEFGQEYRHFEIIACYGIDYETEECDDEYSHFIRISKGEVEEIWGGHIGYLGGPGDEGEAVISYAIDNNLIPPRELEEIIMFQGVVEVDDSHFKDINENINESDDFGWVKDVPLTMNTCEAYGVLKVGDEIIINEIDNWEDNPSQWDDGNDDVQTFYNVKAKVLALDKCNNIHRTNEHKGDTILVSIEEDGYYGFDETWSRDFTGTLPSQCQRDNCMFLLCDKNEPYQIQLNKKSLNESDELGWIKDTVNTKLAKNESWILVNDIDRESISEGHEIQKYLFDLGYDWNSGDFNSLSDFCIYTIYHYADTQREWDGGNKQIYYQDGCRASGVRISDRDIKSGKHMVYYWSELKPKSLNESNDLQWIEDIKPTWLKIGQKFTGINNLRLSRRYEPKDKVQVGGMTFEIYDINNKHGEPHLRFTHNDVMDGRNWELKKEKEISQNYGGTKFTQAKHNIDTGFWIPLTDCEFITPPILVGKTKQDGSPYGYTYCKPNMSFGGYLHESNDFDWTDEIPSDYYPPDVKDAIQKLQYWQGDAYQTYDEIGLSVQDVIDNPNKTNIQDLIDVLKHWKPYVDGDDVYWAVEDLISSINPERFKDLNNIGLFESNEFDWVKGTGLGKVDLRNCKPGDILVTRSGKTAEYVGPSEGHYDHEIKFEKDSYGTRTHDGYVFRKNRRDDDDDIIKVMEENKKPITEVAGISFEARKWGEIIYNEIMDNPNEKKRLIIDGYGHPEAFDGFPIDYVIIDFYDRLTGYGQEHSGYDKDGNYIVLLYIQPKLVQGQGGYDLRSVLNHEMKHAWDDYNRLSKGLPSIDNNKESKELYNKDFILMLSDQNVRGPIKELLKYYYYLSKLETTAYLENVYDENPVYERVVREIAGKDFEPFKERFDLDVNWHLMNTAYDIPFLKKFKSPKEFIDYSSEELRSRAIKTIKKINKMKYVHKK